MATGDIGAALIDQLALPAICDITEGDVIHVQDEWFVVAHYENGTTDIIVSSFSVSDTGTIPASFQDTMTLATATGTIPRLQSITKSGGIFGIFYMSTSGACGDFTLETYSLDGCGNISTCPIDTLTINQAFPGPRVSFEPTNGAGIFVIQYHTTLATVSIDACGAIGNCLLDTFSAAGLVGVTSWPNIVWTGVGDYHAFATTGVACDGFVRTLTIDACGTFGCAVADVLEFDTSQGEEISIGSNDNGTLFLYYEGPTSGGDVTTVTVDGCGMLTLGDDISAGSISGEKTALLRIDELGNKNVFLGASNSAFFSWSFDSCNNITQVDTLTPITEINDHPALAFLPDSSNIVVGCGYQAACQEFFVYSLKVSCNIDAGCSGASFGAIGSVIIDQILVDATGDTASAAAIAHATGDYFAVVYHDAGAPGTTTLASIICDNVGDFGAAIVDTIVVATTGSCTGPDPTMVKVDDGIVAVAYWSDGGGTEETVVKAFGVDACGTITLKDSLVLGTGGARVERTRIRTTIHPGTFAVTQGASGAPKVNTFTIDSSGNISVVLDTLSPTDAQSFAHITGTYHVSTRTDACTDGHIFSYTIASNGNFGSVADTLEFDTGQGTDAVLGSGPGKTVAIVYRGVAGVERIVGILSDDSGTLSKGDNTITYVTNASAFDAELLAITPSILLAACKSELLTFNINEAAHVVEIDNSGNLFAGTDWISFPSLAKIPGTDIILVCGTDQNGNVKVFSIEICGAAASFGLLPRQQIKLLLT